MPKGRSIQGRYLLGETLDSRPGGALLQHISIDTSSAADANGAAFSQFAVVEGYLQATLSGTVYTQDAAEFVGVTMTASDGATLRIADTVARDSSITEYYLEVMEGGDWQPLCKDGDYALALAGVWSEDGTHSDDANRMSFACADGVAAKCLTWGYGPWISTDGRAYHQACTRMARADYCGIGQSNTFNGTEIDMADMRGPAGDKANVWPDDLLPLEAAWRADSASVLDPLSEGLVCLARRRWQAMPLGGYCPELLADPRLILNPGTSCDSYENLDEMAADGALIFNGSGYYDVGLYTWTNLTQTLTTTAGYCAGLSLTGNEEPAPGYRIAVYRGVLLTDAGAALVEAQVPGIQLKSVTTWQNGSEAFVTTTETPPTGYSQQVREEGYVFATESDALQFVADSPVLPAPLYVYRNLLTGDYLTTTDTIPPVGYMGQTEIGWILRPIVPGLDSVCTVVL